jgi:hypothetical protein
MRPDLIEYSATRQPVHSTARPADEQHDAMKSNKPSGSTIALTSSEIDEAFAIYEARKSQEANTPATEPGDQSAAQSGTKLQSGIGTLPHLDSIPCEASETRNKAALVQTMREQLETLERQHSRLSQFITNIKSSDVSDLESAR